MSVRLRMKNVEESVKEVREIFHELLREDGVYSAMALAVLTLATVIHMNAHPIYIVEAKDVLATGPGE